MTEQPTPEPRKSIMDLRDLTCFLGIGLTAYGAWMIYPPAGFIAPGVILTAISVFGVRG